MTPDEARKTKLGADFLANHLSGADPYATPGVSELGRRAPEGLTECFTCVAIAAATTIREIAGFATIEEVFPLLPPEDTLLIPDAQPDRDAAILLALGRTKDGAEPLDVATAVNSSFGLALSAVKDLARRTTESTIGWAQLLSEGVDREAGGAETQDPSPG